MRVLGVDPGLTRCGLGVVEGSLGRPLSLVEVLVARTATDRELPARLVGIAAAVREIVGRTHPDAMVVERVFSQQNVQSVMGTAQAAAAAVIVAEESGLPVHWHTPTEVKAAVTGTGAATKEQVAAMVVRILHLPGAPRPVDATDALALAICHIWRGSAQQRLAAVAAVAPQSRIPRATAGNKRLVLPPGGRASTVRRGAR